MGFITFLAAFHFKSKVKEGSHKGKNMFFKNFWALLLKVYHFCVCDIFFYLVVIQSTQFFSVCTYISDVFGEAFFVLTIRMPMVTKLFRVVTCGEELSLINTHDISTEGSCWVT